MSSPSVQSTHPTGTDGLVRCMHGEQADRCTSQSARNPGRDYYRCSRPQGERCSFWYWTDDPLFQRRPTPPAQNASGLCTPRASPAQSTPTKRRPENAMQSPSASASNKKARLEAIKAGLRARVEDEARVQPLSFDQADALPFTGGMEQSQTASAADTDTDTDTKQDGCPPARYSFLGLPPTQESESGASPSTPKKQPASFADGRPELYGLRAEPSSSTLPTPPQSMRPHVNRADPFACEASGSGASRPEPVTPTRYKGKERAHPEWDHLVAVGEEYIFGESSSSSSLQSRLEQHSPQRASADCPDLHSSPTTGERIASNITVLRNTMDQLRAFADVFDQLDAAKYVERLERQKKALEIKDEAKKKHIAALTAERDELKDKVGRLEERCREQDRVIALLR